MFFLFASNVLTIKGAAKPCHILVKSYNLPEVFNHIEDTVKEDLHASLKFDTTFSSDPYLYLVEMDFKTISGGKCDLNVKIIDNATKEVKHVNHIVYSTSKQNWRHLSHAISDFVFEKIQGLKGHFSSKIAFVRRYDEDPSIKSRLFLCDYDGHNQSMLVESRDVIIGVAFSRCGGYIAYRTLHARRGQNIYIYNLKSNSKMDLTAKLKGQLGKDMFGKNISALSFGAHADEILYAKSKNGSTTLHSYHLKTGQSQLLTRPRRYIIQTCPVRSSDGQTLLFSADESGREAVHVVRNGVLQMLPMDTMLDFSQPKLCENVRAKDRIFFSGRGRGFSSVWYVDQAEDMRPIPIVVMRKPYFVEKPCPAKNGEYVIYLQQNGRQHAVVMIDAKGNEIMKPGTEAPFLSVLGGNVTDIAYD